MTERVTCPKTDEPCNLTPWTTACKDCPYFIWEGDRQIPNPEYFPHSSLGKVIK